MDLGHHLLCRGDEYRQRDHRVDPVDHVRRRETGLGEGEHPQGLPPPRGGRRHRPRKRKVSVNCPREVFLFISVEIFLLSNAESATRTSALPLLDEERGKISKIFPRQGPEGGPAAGPHLRDAQGEGGRQVLIHDGGPQVFICEMIRISKEERATRTSEVSH